NRGGFSHPLEAARRERRGRLQVDDRHGRHLLRGRKQVIYERGRERLTLRIVYHLFQQRLPKPLCQAAVNLTVDDAGIDERAAICNAFDLTPAAAWRRAPPPAIIARLANVPVPTGTEAVSTGTTSTSSGERPSVSPTNWAKTVSCPCPWEGVETYARTPPEPSTLTAALSSPRTSRMPRRRNVSEPIPVYSTKAERPTPTIRPAARS